MAQALRLVLPMDGLASIILISDGAPDSETEALDVAARFKHPISTVFIGSDKESLWGGGSGKAFLEALARATGGQSVKSASPGLLREATLKLLTEGQSSTT